MYINEGVNKDVARSFYLQSPVGDQDGLSSPSLYTVYGHQFTSAHMWTIVFILAVVLYTIL